MLNAPERCPRPADGPLQSLNAPNARRCAWVPLGSWAIVYSSAVNSVIVAS